MKCKKIISLLLAVCLLLGLAPLGGSRVWADSERDFVDQPEDVLIDEGATGTLHWSVSFTPENNDTYWLTGGYLPEDEALKIYTSFRYRSGSDLLFAENLPEMNIIMDESWINENPYRIKFRDELGTEHFSDPFYVRYAPKRFIVEPQTVFVPTDDPEAKVPITWAVNFTPDADKVFKVVNRGFGSLYKWVDEFFEDRAGDPAISRKTMEVMADASMISELPYMVCFYDYDEDHWVSAGWIYIYPEGMGLITEQPKDVLIVDGQPAPLSWTVDFTPENWINDWGERESVFLFKGGNIHPAYLYDPESMYGELSNMTESVTLQPEMTLMAQPGWVSDSPYQLIINQKDCPDLFSEPFYIRAAHRVTFVQNEYGLAIPEQIVLDGECASEPVLAAEREGYTFGGWYKDAAFTESYDFAQPVTEQLTLYAKWSINYYRVDYDTCGGTPLIPPMMVPYWDVLSVPAEPSREGGVFRGWFTDASYEHAYDFSSHVTGPLKLYAKWDIPEYTVNFQNKGIGIKPPVQKVEYGETASRPADPAADGYIFGGWWIDGAEYDFASPVKRNLTLWAKWTKICQITFDAGGGSGSMAPETALQGESYTAPACEFTAPEGKRFRYWAVSTDLYYKHPGQQVSISDDTVFTAVWDYVPSRSVTFNMNGHGEQIPPVWVELNTALAKPPEAPSEDGWTFTGWYTTKSAADSASSAYLYDFSKPVTNNVTLYAGWQDNTLYKIRLSYGGSGYGHAVLTGEGIEQLDDETYLAHPGIWVEVAATPAEGSRTGEDVWGSNWIEANNQPIGGTKRFRMTAAETYVTVSFTMKPIEEGGHLHDAATLTHVAERPATCTVDGCIEHYECPVCGQWFYFDDFYQEFRSVFSVEYYTEHATGHVPADPVQENIDPATCEGDGFCDVVIYCSVCGEELEREFTDIPATGHAWSEPVYEWAADYASLTATHTCANDPDHVESETVDVWEDVYGATCEYGEWHVYYSDGFMTYGFAAQYLERETAPALGHAWDDGYVDTAPTCETDGVLLRSCTRCGEVFNEAIPALGHDWTDVTYTWSADHASCTMTAACARDAEHAANETAEAVFAVQTPATCERDGTGVWTASFEDPAFEPQMVVETIPAAGHTEGAARPENVVAATCTQAGSLDMVVRCTVCGKVVSSSLQPIDALGHAWGDWTQVTPATEAAEGSEKRTCSRCGETETRAIPKLSHTHVLVKTEALDPTCTEAGNIAYWTCSGCGKHFSDAADSAEIELSAVSRAALGHAYTAAVTAPTCTEGGCTTHTCSRCGDKYKDEETAALGHNWSEWIEVYPASIYEAGSEKRMCGRCGVTEFRDIPQLPDPTVRVSGSIAGDALSYTLANAPDGSVLIAARYEDGRLTDLKIVGGGADSGTIDMGGSGDEFALFLVDSSGSPLCPDWSN